MCRTNLAIAALVACTLSVSAVALPTTAFAAEDVAARAASLLTERCFECHGPDAQEAGLRLDDRDAALAELDSGAVAIVPGAPNESELPVRVTESDPDYRMPPDGPPLTSDEVSLLREWIAAGAPWNSHWAYQALERPKPPAVSDEAWPRGDLDRFVLARLDAAGVAPSPEADAYTLIRRLHLDLIGLPPEPAQADRWAASWSDKTYAELVDELLASEHFGERWGRHWLDKARYADSDGYEKDNPRPEAWHYRDWVIDAINRDLPYDQFATEQLAGDLLPKPTQDQLLATAFHRQTLTNTEGGVDQEEFRVAAVMDRVETLGTVWLGLTVGCARCHSHKFDQISQDEYYGLFAFFNNADETSTRIGFSEQDQQRYEQALADHRAAVAELQSRIEAAETTEENVSETEDAVSQHLADLKKELESLKQQAPRPPGVDVRVVSERPQDERRTTHVLRRGDFLQPEHAVTPGVLASLTTLTPRDPDSLPDRLDLAGWLFDGVNPLPPRVVANQFWAHLFGTGLVDTMNDFGVRGEPPTHPELLDWLAAELTDGGWSRKHLIRTIVLSSTYRQASAHRPELVDLDPANQLLHRQNRFRVEAEIIRDSALAASGLLSEKIGGPSVFPPLPPSIAELTYNSSFQWKTSTGEDRYRRGMYTYFKRTAPHPNLTTFDCPDSVKTAVDRQRSNTPIGALVTLNNEVFVEAAQALARRLLTELPDASDDKRLRRALRLCVARPPADEEVAKLHLLLDDARAWYVEHPAEAVQLTGQGDEDSAEDFPEVSSEAAEQAAWVAVARVVLNLDEFLTRE